MPSSSPTLCLSTGTVRVRRSGKTRHKIPRAGRTAYTVIARGLPSGGVRVGRSIATVARGLAVASLRVGKSGG